MLREEPLIAPWPSGTSKLGQAHQVPHEAVTVANQGGAVGPHHQWLSCYPILCVTSPVSVPAMAHTAQRNVTYGELAGDGDAASYNLKKVTPFSKQAAL